MRTLKVFVNRNETFNPAVVSPAKGKYGLYCKINGVNRSEKNMIEMGYLLENLTEDQIKEITATQKAIKDAEQKIYHDKKMSERFESVASCLKSAPVKIIVNTGDNHMVTKVANLTGTEMINQYHGSGKGTAYINNNEVVAFHYGYEQPFNAPINCEAINVQFSGTQICFF